MTGPRLVLAGLVLEIAAALYVAFEYGHATASAWSRIALP
jgi:hypothetical protein